MRRPRDLKYIVCEPPQPGFITPGPRNQDAIVGVCRDFWTEDGDKLRRFAAWLIERAKWLDQENAP